MPNHVTNEITIKGTAKQIGDVREFMKSDENPFDFNKLIPDNSGDNWYDWRRHNWGTKWNSYGHEIKDNVIRFDTAWTHPMKVIEALTKKFPKIQFDIRFADEDLGYNCGTYSVKNSKILTSNLPEGGSIEAYSIALDVKNYENYLEDVFNDYEEDEYGDYLETLLTVAVKDGLVNDRFPQWAIKKAVEMCDDKTEVKKLESLLL